MTKHDSKRQRARLFEEGKNSCYWCGRVFTNFNHLECTLEHIIPLSEGGTWHKDNLAISCSYCQGGRFVNKVPLVERQKQEAEALLYYPDK